MATNVGTLQAQLYLDYSKFHSGMESSISDAKNLGSALQNAFNGFNPNQATVVSQARQLSAQITSIFSKTQATIRVVMDTTQAEQGAHQINQWVASIRDTLSSNLSTVIPRVDIQPATQQLDALVQKVLQTKTDINNQLQGITPSIKTDNVNVLNLSGIQSELANLQQLFAATRVQADQQLHNIRPSIHIGNANRSLNTLQANLQNFRTQASQPVQISIQMDTSAAMASLLQIQTMAQQVGSSLSNSLGNFGTQGFSSASQALSDMAAAIANIIAQASAFNATMQNMNQTLQQISAVRTYTSQLAQEFNNIAQSANAAAMAVRELGDELFQLVGLLTTLNSGHADAFADIVAQINTMTTAAQNFSAAMAQARSNTQTLVPNTQSTASNTGRAANNANNLANNLRMASRWANRAAQVISGIVISQAFYQITGIIRSWIGMANEFAWEMEQAAISFKYLMGDAAQSAAFIEALQDFAVESPLDMQGAEKAARLLMTMGISAKNTIPVLRVLTDTAAVAGGEIEDTVYRISLALGQMLQSGTVKMQEVRQLVNANIPIFDILREELGLTSQQVAAIGKEGVDSAQAVNGILRGLQKRFSGASKELQKTTRGALSAIKDSFAVLWSLIWSSPFNFLREQLVKVSDVMQTMVRIARRLGPGGLFEAMFPPQTQALIRNLIGAFGQLVEALKYYFIILGTVFGDTLKLLANILNFVLPPLAILANTVMQLAVYFYKSSPAVRLFVAALVSTWVITRLLIPTLVRLWRILGFASLFTFARNAVLGFGRALIWLVSNPIALAIAGIVALIAVIMAVTGAFGGLVGGIKNVINWWSNLNKTLSERLKIGYDPNKILQPWKDKQIDKNAQDYLGQLEAIEDAMGDVGDKADKTKKKLKKSFLQSFDEVYQIKPKDDDVEDTLKDLNLDQFPIDLFNPIDDTLIDDIGNIGNIMDGLELPSDAWWKKWKDLFNNWPDWLPLVLAAALGAIIGAVLGGAGGALIGAAIGLLCGWLWQKLAEMIGIKDKNWAMAASAIMAAILGLLTFALTGNAIWAGLAAALGFFAGLFWEKIAEAFGLKGAKKQEAAISSAIGAVFGAILGGIIGGPLGAVIGALLGTFSGEFWSILADKLGLSTSAKYAGLVAGGLAAVLGAALGSSTISATLARWVPTFYRMLAAAFSGATASLGGAGSTILNLPIGGLLLNTASIAALAATWISTFIQGIQTGDWSGLIPAITGTIGRILLGPIGGLAGTIAGHFYNATFNSLKEQFGLSNMDKIRDVLVVAFNGLVTGFMSWMIPIITPIGAQVGNFTLTTLTNGLKGGIAGIITGLLSAALSNVLLKFMGEGLDLTDRDIKNGKVGQQIGGVVGSIIGGIIGFFAGGPAGATIGAAIGNFIGQPLGAAIGGLWENYIKPAWDTIVSFWSEFFSTTLPNALGTAWTAVSNFFTQTIPQAWNSFWTWLGTIPGMIASWFGQVTNDIAYWFGFVVGYVAHGLVNIFTAIGNFFTQTIPQAWNSFWTWLGTLPGVIQQWFTNAWTTVTTWLGNIFTAIGNFFTQTLPQAWSSFCSWVGTLPGIIAGWFSSAWTTVTTWLGNFVTSIVTFFTQTIPTAWNNFWTWLGTIPGILAGWFSNLWSNFVTWGGNLVQGLVQGVQDAWNGLTGWIGDLVHSFTNGFTDGWDINSPSRVFQDIGGNIIDGLFLGIEEKWAGFTEYITGICTAVADTISGAFTGMVEPITTWATNTATAITTWVTDTGTAISTWVTDKALAISTWVTDTGTAISTWTTDRIKNISDWATNTGTKIADWAIKAKTNFQDWYTKTKDNVVNWANVTWEKIRTTTSNCITKISDFVTTTTTNIASWSTKAIASAGTFATNFANKVATGTANALRSIGSFVSSATSQLASWASSMASTISSVLSRAASAASSALSSAGSRVSSFLSGHATGGIYNREHIARISEGNKAEAIIPLQNASAMQPFVDAVSKGLTETLAPIMARANNERGDTRTPVYVGTLIADERSLKELERKMNVIRLQEKRRTT